jgi:hypothetical protein
MAGTVNDPASAGCLYKRFTSVNNTTAVAVNASAGVVHGILATNANAALRYLKVYNVAAASVNSGTTVPDLTIPIPATNYIFFDVDGGIPFSTAISFNLTTGIADNDNTAVAAGEITVTVFYK